MPDTRKKLGHFGEQAALGYLARQGLHEITRNWRCVTGEIDLVVRDGSTLVFVEVRTRRAVSALESVDARKREKLAALAYAYLEAHELADTTAWRIDVVGVQISPNGTVAALDWVRNAVEM